MLPDFEAGAFDLTEEASAKINLALHVTGRRADGYHLLDMLVTFTRHGDRLGFRSAKTDSFTLSGRFAPLLSADAPVGSNLVLKARDLLRDAVQAAGFDTPAVHIHLEKNLPVASGIGGGSADAAAALRGLMHLWNVTLPGEKLAEIALKLGADVPMCLSSRPLIARGIGEEIMTLPGFPSMSLVLGNPLVGVSTPDVFRALESRDNPKFDFDPLQERRRQDWLDVVGSLRNDLEAPARTLCADIAAISRMLSESGALLTRMSGSGATCFGIFAGRARAETAAELLHRQKPGWYFQATETISGDE
ncbi:4-(cytidine 5'-diphospho)-2-C-methyl-D-erythritol kinase [Neorhizobium sp. P12A]|uniref:4-(cytidine 5'-diphospho)-2-C-methyl-D-erythritol kinase n=1 Tax=Rhizobium/Agrobacterium group TaxID=227290 RepID=UPI00104CD9F6|nr:MULTISPECIES: 4-(cytidine 5'-diphospho)-2-C-methyl-D-erythritol kinase [Rhizobium/Agrobacterium group]KAA0699677.1 4-(cytidine 5'-diphospho)-2-C-methyl-D-erythritol kinase [Neorhizobium sp. P12A]TCR91307.1 4-diphosphocytidyl-2-C-methyl-D-erythritol kinase [Rhizobium sp. BK376]